MKKQLNIISLGAGVQSSTMALMAAHGEIEPMPDAGIFADTQWESRRVYDWLDELDPLLSFPIHRVTKGNLRQDILDKAEGHSGKRFAAVPFFMNGGRGMGRRQCTQEYKLYPLWRKAKEILGWPEGKRVPPATIRMWIGISTDEAHRMKPSTVKYIENTFPLIDKRMSRGDCVAWLKRNGYPIPPKSSCLGCPFHSNEQWREVRRNEEEWMDTCHVDDRIRHGGTNMGMQNQQFMHRSCVPLSEADIDQGIKDQYDLFGNECEGMCGV